MNNSHVSAESPSHVNQRFMCGESAESCVVYNTVISHVGGIYMWVIRVFFLSSIFVVNSSCFLIPTHRPFINVSYQHSCRVGGFLSRPSSCRNIKYHTMMTNTNPHNYTHNGVIFARNTMCGRWIGKRAGKIRLIHAKKIYIRNNLKVKTKEII